MKRFILTTLSIIFSVFTFGQTPDTKMLDSLFNALHQKNSFNGNVLIAEKGNVIFEKSYGFAKE